MMQLPMVRLTGSKARAVAGPVTVLSGRYGGTEQ